MQGYESYISKYIGGKGTHNTGLRSQKGDIVTIKINIVSGWF